jgi:hypothetical protein
VLEVESLRAALGTAEEKIESVEAARSHAVALKEKALQVCLLAW